MATKVYCVFAALGVGWVAQHRKVKDFRSAISPWAASPHCGRGSERQRDASLHSRMPSMPVGRCKGGLVCPFFMFFPTPSIVGECLLRGRLPAVLLGHVAWLRGGGGVDLLGGVYAPTPCPFQNVPARQNTPENAKTTSMHVAAGTRPRRGSTLQGFPWKVSVERFARAWSSRHGVRPNIVLPDRGLPDRVAPGLRFLARRSDAVGTIGESSALFP